MTSAQQFAGDLSSQLHQFNGNLFNGPVSISTPDPKDRGNLIAVQGDSRRKFAGHTRDGVDEGSESSLKEDLSWVG
jgi:hypothetical protein